MSGMKTHKHDIIFFSSDALAAAGLCEVLNHLPVKLKVLAVEDMHDIVFHCEKYRPKLVVYLFHENMPLGGVLQRVFTHQRNYPDVRQLIITCKLLPIFSAFMQYFTTVNVIPLKTPLVELSWLLTTELMGLRGQLQNDHCADVMLSDRQLKILLMLSWSYSAEQVGQRLGITDKTVYAHKLNALTRLHIHSRHDIADLFAVIDELRMIVTMLRCRPKEKEVAEIRTDKIMPPLVWKNTR